MWKQRNRMTEDEDEFYPDDSVFDEDESPRKSFWQNLFAGKSRARDEDDRDDTIDDFDDLPPSGKSGGKRWLLLGCAAVAVAAVVLCFSGRFQSDGSTLYSALSNSGSEINAWLEDSSPLFESTDRMKELMEDGDFAVNLTMDTNGGAVNLDMDYSRNKKLMSGVVNWNSGKTPGGLDVVFSADKKELRLSAPALVNDVYGLRFKDFGEVEGNLTTLLKIFPDNISLPEKKWDPFSPMALDKLLKDRAGKSWAAFKKSLRIKEFATRDVRVGEQSKYCTIYQISWDPAAADALARDLSGMLTAIPVGIMTLLPNMEPDCRLFVDEHDRVIGGDCSVLGKKYTILMYGETNFWEDFSVEVLSAAEPARYLTGDVEVTKAGIGLRISDDAHDLLCASYDNATGNFQINTPDATLLEGSLAMTDSTVKMVLGVTADPVLVLELAPLSRYPIINTEKYVDIAGMSLNELNRIVMEIQNNLCE